MRPLALSLALALLAAPRAARADDYGSLGGDGQLGAFRYRAWHGRDTRTGWQLGGGQAVMVRVRPFYVGLVQGFLGRWMPDQGFQVASSYDTWAAVQLGPVQPEVRLGLNTISLDHLAGQWSVQLLSPRVGAGVSLHLGRVDLGVFVFREYMWRWFGDDQLLQGLYLDFRAEGLRQRLTP